uniref:Uncharacterized protein n=1 Tax=Arundo donax TaxID=35708 RepID=A0A0A9BKD0_ARUDO
MGLVGPSTWGWSVGVRAQTVACSSHRLGAFSFPLLHITEGADMAVDSPHCTCSYLVIEAAPAWNDGNEKLRWGMERSLPHISGAVVSPALKPSGSGVRTTERSSGVTGGHPSRM